HPKVKSQKEAKKIKSAPKHLLATPGEGVEAVSKSTSAHPTAKTPQAFDARTGEVEALDLKSVEVKTGDAKPADVKAVGVKTGAVETVDAKPVEVKAVDAKAGAVEAVDAKPVEVKTAKQESAAPGKGCEDAALKKIYDLMLHDQANTLGIMFELTAMRLAKRSLEQMPKATTFEELTRGNIKTLEKRLNGIKSSVEMQKQVKEIYETYGKKNDLKLISKDLNQMMKRNHDACYFSKNQRFQNDEASSYILAVSVGEKDSEVSDIDAATVWVVERARAEAEKTDPEHYALGKENGNLLNISTRVSRYLGRIEDGKNATADVMADLIQTEEKKLVSVLAGAYLQVKTSLKTCLLQETNNCEKCTLTRLDNFEKEKGGIDQIQRGLLSSVAKSDNLKMEQDLKGKMGDVVYDFSNFAKKGEKDVIPPNPPRGKYDACGHVLGASHAGPAKAPVSRSPGTKAPSNNQVGPESIAPLDPRIVPAN
ncbi:MAG: hypothetical protein H7333_11000, partial [Bdellovibrionales bacterium]|nr:hypothetical protein [Oligoflexia bacterium]